MMKKFMIAAIAAMSLFTASPALSKGTDGYEFSKKEIEHTEIQLSIVVVRDFFMLRQIAVDKYHVDEEDAKPLVAFSAWSPKNNKCVIYVVDPARLYLPDQYGHELMHCVYGNFHRDGEAKSSLKMSNIASAIFDMR